jgi:hypothetical protein
MSKKIYLDAFFDQYEDLLKQCRDVFPTDPDWPIYLTGLAVFRRTNPGVVAQMTWTYVAPYEELILKRDQSFFLDRDFAAEAAGDASIEQTISKLKAMWGQLTPHNQSILWEYITNITVLAKKCAA